MNLILPATSMGDVLMSTGLPHAYYVCFREKMHIVNPRNLEFWSNNPYITPDYTGGSWNLTHNARRDYMIYYPVRLFFDMTGLIVDRKLVQPNIYTDRYMVDDKLIVVSDQAGWPSRRGYPHYNELLLVLQHYHYKIVYVRNTHFRDCFGTLNEKTLIYNTLIENPTTAELIAIMRTAAVYIGYESGYCSLAGALNVPYVVLTSSVPPINVCHDSCIYALDICSGYCCAEKCDRMCLHSAPNKNDEILEKIIEQTRLS